MLRFVNARNDKKKLKEIKELYDTAFPKEERMPFWLLRKNGRKSIADLMGVYDNEEFVGMIHLVYYEDIVYLFFLAVSPEARGQGYGSRIIQALHRRFPSRRIILNIEQVVEGCDSYEERRKRKEFYLRNGLKEAGYLTKEFDVVYEMLYLGETVSFDEYWAMMSRYFGKIAAKVMKKWFTYHEECEKLPESENKKAL